jgi:hypothetical protein
MVSILIDCPAIAKNCGDRRAFSAERISYLQEPVNELFCQDEWMISMTRDGISLEIERSERAPGPLPGPGRDAALDRLETLGATVIQPEQGPPPASDLAPVHLSAVDRGRAATTFDQLAQSMAGYEASHEVTAFSSQYDAVLAGKAQFAPQEQQGYDLPREGTV